MMGKKIRLKYPKFLLFFTTIIVAYLIFHGREYSPFRDFVVELGYSGTFVAGILFVYGFAAAPATAIFLILGGSQNIYLASLVGGLGAMVGDLFIFSFVRYSFADEIKKLSEEKLIRHIKGMLPGTLKKYLLPVAAAFIIASPLPDEIGVALMAASKSVSTKTFPIISYLLNTAGIFVILSIGQMI